jgi:apolipoprotein N-acyltransferase
MILPQAWFGAWLGDYIAGRNGGIGPYVKKNLVAIICYGVLVIASLIFGFCSMSYWNAQEPDLTWKVVTVQHNHDSWKGGYETYKKNFNNLRALTLQALQKNPDADMVIWSETAFVPSVAWHENYTSPDEDIAKLVEEFVSFGKELPVPLLTGNPEGVLDDPSLPSVLENGQWNRTDYNTVIFFEDGEIKETYRKQHLVPFTEHFPYEKQIPWLYNLLLANDYNWWEKGTVPVVFRTEEGVTFSTPICFEDVFGYLTADFVRNGADVIVNMTNDSWSGAVSAEMQHLAMAVFRSVETRRTTVRGTNSGMTCVIAPDGRIIDPMEPFKMAWHAYDVPVYSKDTHGLTLYAEHDDWFAWVMVYASLALLLVSGGYQIFKAVRDRRAAGR